MVLQQLTLSFYDSDPEPLSDFLLEAGALSVTFLDAADEPIYEPALNTTPLWPHTKLLVLFEATVSITDILLALKRNFSSVEALGAEKLVEKVWEKEGLKNLQPLLFGKRLWVCPTFIDPPDKTAFLVYIDPGLAFGTGYHPTTALCLEWLERHPPIAETVLDFGCGSGILSIAALKLGATQAYAVDHDPQALEATQVNGLINKIPENKLLVFLPEELSSSKISLILANILLEPLMKLAEKFYTLLNRNGKLILSGILSDQLNMLQSAYHSHFLLEKIEEKAGWLMLEFSPRVIIK